MAGPNYIDQNSGKYPLQITVDLGLTEAIENNANGQPVYHGYAMPGTAKSAAGWRIKKITYDGNGFLTDVQWAGSVNTFSQVWDNRSSLSYG